MVKMCIGIKQDKAPCTYSAKLIYNNLYCKKHGAQWLQHDKKGKFKFCTSRTQCDKDKKGVKAQLPLDFPYAHCDNCREHARNTDKKHLEKIKEENKESIIQKCIKCRTIITSKKQAVTERYGISQYCKSCFKQRQAIQKKRIKDKEKERARSKEYESRPEVKAMRKRWKLKNPGKIYSYYTGYRARKLSENPDEYRKNCAEIARLWRKNNPDKMKQMYEERRCNVEYSYSLYIYRANRDGYDLEISFNEFKKMITDKCYYCEIKFRKFLLGIDRVDNSKGYIKNNVVTCCKTCNEMKNTYSEETFILMCAHIANVNHCSKFKEYPQIFNDYKGTTDYAKYKYRATSKKIEFNISEKMFDNIRQDECYVCNKENSEKHFNGIDRFDNNIGYFEENCRSCCGSCNYMKKNYNFMDFVLQCAYIADVHRDRLDELEKNWEPSKFAEKNLNKIKLTDEEKLEIKQERDRVRHEKTMSTKTTEAISRIAASKKKKKEVIEV